MEHEDNLYTMSAKLDDVMLIDSLRNLLSDHDCEIDESTFLRDAIPLLEAWLQDVRNSECAFSRSIAA